jgi:ATP-dependent Lon protease
MAMTGEITLRGKVLPVGGIKFWRLSVPILKRSFFVTKIKDIDEIKPEYIQGLTFHYVKEMSDVLKIAITDQN